MSEPIQPPAGGVPAGGKARTSFLIILLVALAGVIIGAAVYWLIDRPPRPGIGDPIWCETLGEWVKNPNDCPDEIDGMDIILNPTLVTWRKDATKPNGYTIEGKIRLTEGTRLGPITVVLHGEKNKVSQETILLYPGNGVDVRFQHPNIARWEQTHVGDSHGYIYGARAGETTAVFEIKGMYKDRIKNKEKWPAIVQFGGIPVIVTPPSEHP